MKIIESGDLWVLRRLDWLVVFTNIGWNKDGHNVMGRGIALEANRAYPGLAENYGRVLKHAFVAEQHHIDPGCMEELVWYEQYKIILMPTKPLNKEAPHLSWSQPSDLGLIERGLKRLQAGNWDKVFMGVPGCANGKLDQKDVLPLCENILDDRFTVVRRRDK